jgi:predicted DNA-binding protein (UPF0251 family)
MPRHRRLRKIVSPPNFKGYKPYGNKKYNKQYIELLYEEYEAIKLSDYELLKHDEACELMGISRATFARIYESARRKIAKAFVEAKEIKTAYGNAWFEKDWFICNDCHSRFNIPKNGNTKQCPLCKKDNIELIDKNI